MITPLVFSNSSYKKKQITFVEAYIFLLQLLSQACDKTMILRTITRPEINTFYTAGHGEVYMIERYVIKFVSDLRQVMVRCT